MLLPAVCDNCGAFFTPHAINAENVRGLTISNVAVGPCPRCGGMGHIPDGVYNIVGNVLEVLSAPAHSIDELRRLSEILRQAKAKNESPEIVKERIRKESPGLSKLADLIPKDRTELYTFIGVAIAAASLIVQLARPGEKTTSVTVNQVINNITIEAAKDLSAKKALPANPGAKKVAPTGSEFRKAKRRLKKSERKRRRQ